MQTDGGLIGKSSPLESEHLPPSSPCALLRSSFIAGLRKQWFLQDPQQQKNGVLRVVEAASRQHPTFV